MRRPSSVLLVAVLALGAVGCAGGIDEARLPAPATPGTTPESTSTPGTTPASEPDVDPGPTDPASAASLSPWEPCGAPLECATLTVPRDWSAADGDTLEVAVARRPATGDRIGPLMLNPGGPGASGIDFLRSLVDRDLPDELGERFDLVSWDPRGSGASEPIDCTDDAELLEPDIDPTPDDDAEVEALRADARDATDTCIAEVGDLLGQVGTRATVRDLEALRGSIGPEDITYLGYSYGTTIGLEYLHLYGDRTRAMVLDGVAIPGVDPVEDTRTQAEGFESTLDAYLADCPNRPGCPLGADPKARLLEIADRLDAERIPASYRLQAAGSVDREGTVGSGELYIAVASALYRTQAWPTLDQAFTEVLATPSNGRTLLALRDDYLGRQVDGTWADDHDARAAIRCADQAERPAEPEGDLELAAQWGEDLPFWGEWFGVGLPGCWGLPDATEPLGPLEADDLADAPPVVLVGSTQDPATPYSQATDAHALLAGSELITYEGAEHTVTYLGLTACVDDPVTAYLVDLQMPEPDLRCSP